MDDKPSAEADPELVVNKYAASTHPKRQNTVCALLTSLGPREKGWS
jgi:hypothetical protein